MLLLLITLNPWNCEQWLHFASVSLAPIPVLPLITRALPVSTQLAGARERVGVDVHGPAVRRRRKLHAVGGLPQLHLQVRLLGGTGTHGTEPQVSGLTPLMPQGRTARSHRAVG